MNEFIIAGCDWGPVTYQLVLPSIKKDKYQVIEVANNQEYLRKIIKQEIVDDKLIITLEIDINTGSIYTYDPIKVLNTYQKNYYFKLVSDKKEYLIKDYKLRYDYEFGLGTYHHSSGISYQYAYHKEESDTLLVWLHGLGEGKDKASDPLVCVYANKVTSLVSPSFQEKVKKVSVVVPQCPSFWMEVPGKKVFDGNSNQDSIYLESLMDFIKYYRDVFNAKKIVIAGASNGGYMTMLLAIKEPNLATCYIPICEALKDEYISDQDILNIKDLDMFFIYSKNDQTVDPELYEKPTLKRLSKYSNIKVYEGDKIIDPSGYPLEYNSHCSWVYFFNNQAYDLKSKESVWSWLKTILEEK